MYITNVWKLFSILSTRHTNLLFRCNYLVISNDARSQKETARIMKPLLNRPLASMPQYSLVQKVTFSPRASIQRLPLSPRRPHPCRSQSIRSLVPLKPEREKRFIIFVQHSKKPRAYWKFLRGPIMTTRANGWFVWPQIVERRAWHLAIYRTRGWNRRTPPPPSSNLICEFRTSGWRERVPANIYMYIRAAWGYI